MVINRWLGAQLSGGLSAPSCSGGGMRLKPDEGVVVVVGGVLSTFYLLIVHLKKKLFSRPGLLLPPRLHLLLPTIPVLPAPGSWPACYPNFWSDWKLSDDRSGQGGEA